MKAICWMGPQNMQAREVPDPKIIQPTDVIVRIDTTTICGTDLHILKGDVPEVEEGRILEGRALEVPGDPGPAIDGGRRVVCMNEVDIAILGLADGDFTRRVAPWHFTQDLLVVFTDGLVDQVGTDGERYGEVRLLTVVEADVLKVDFAALARARGVPRLRVVGNLPYNISSPILFHLLQHVASIADQHFMLQKEVVDRMVAAPATSDYGRLSVMLQWRYAMEDVLFVPPESFDPPPRVDSAVVRMVPLPAPVAVAEALLSELVQVAFSQRRKLLRHTLGKWLEGRGFAGTFDVQRRAEEVPVAEYLALARSL